MKIGSDKAMESRQKLFVYNAAADIARSVRSKCRQSQVEI
jgi:hypothetical protein